MWMQVRREGKLQDIVHVEDQSVWGGKPGQSVTVGRDSELHMLLPVSQLI
jgi:hypothetical protein